MEAVARVTSKGQVTIPKAIREALEIETGDALIFQLDAQRRATVAKTRDFLDMAGSIPVPADRRNASWSRVLGETRDARAEGRR
jgi:AbrB family looped-hinge helix DNA binding protein